jgi:hypothetical protein
MLRCAPFCLSLVVPRLDKLGKVFFDDEHVGLINEKLQLPYRLFSCFRFLIFRLVFWEMFDLRYCLSSSSVSCVSSMSLSCFFKRINGEAFCLLLVGVGSRIPIRSFVMSVSSS